MTDLDAWHAGHVAYLLQQLDSVAEGAGTLLDHTVVVWVTELATARLTCTSDAFTVLAGACNGFFGAGRYVRYPQTMVSPMANQPLIGPAHNRLLVSLLQANGAAGHGVRYVRYDRDRWHAAVVSGPLAELRAT